MSEKLDPKYSRVVTIFFIVLTVIVVFVVSYIKNKESEQIEDDGVALRAVVDYMYNPRGRPVAVVYSYEVNGKEFSGSDTAPKAIRSCFEHKKCYGDTITIIVSESKPHISRIKE